jgi:hypothetical protein
VIDATGIRICEVLAEPPVSRCVALCPSQILSYATAYCGKNITSNLA